MTRIIDRETRETDDGRRAPWPEEVARLISERWEVLPLEGGERPFEELTSSRTVRKALEAELPELHFTMQAVGAAVRRLYPQVRLTPYSEPEPDPRTIQAVERLSTVFYNIRRREP